MSIIHRFAIQDANDIYLIDYNPLKKEGLEIYLVGSNFIAFESEGTLTKESQRRILKNPAWHGAVVRTKWNIERNTSFDLINDTYGS